MAVMLSSPRPCAALNQAPGRQGASGQHGRPVMLPASGCLIHPRHLPGELSADTRRCVPSCPATYAFPRLASPCSSGQRANAQVAYAVPTGAETAGDAPVKDNVSKQKILLAVDDCDLSEQALQWVLENLARPGHDDIRLVHVVAGQRTEAATSAICAHSSDNLAGSITGSEEEDCEVVPLPLGALRETWAEQAHGYLQRRFMAHLEKLGCPFEVDLIKEFAERSPAAIGHCICDAAEGFDADVVVVAHGLHHRETNDECKSTANFVAHYCHRPVVMLNRPCLDSYLERSTTQEGASGEWQPQMQWTAQLTRARYPSVTELMGYESKRVLLFAVDERMEAAWAVDWAMETLHRDDDEVHLVYVAKDDTKASKNLQDLESKWRDVGISTHVHVVVGGPPQPVLPEHAQIGNALIRLGKELDARMLFLVNNSRENLDDFLYHSITGHCTQEGVCATVVLHPPYEKGMQHNEDAYLP